MIVTEALVTLNLYEAKTQLSQLVDRAAAGEEVVIAKAGKAMAKLVPIVAGTPKRRESGRNYAGISFIGEDFDAPLPNDVLKSFGS